MPIVTIKSQIRSSAPSVNPSAVSNISLFKVSQAEAEVCHELRNPLHMLAAIINRSDQKLALQDITTMQAIAAHMTTIVQTAPDLANIQTIKLVNKLFNVNETIVNINHMFQQLIDNKKLKLNIVFKDERHKNVAIMADETRFKQIIINLISNAIKFTSHGNITITVEIINTGNHKYILKCNVHNTGIEMTAEQQARLFQSFVQTDSTIKHQHGGTGLGLSLSKALALKLGGDLVVVPKPQTKSTEFSATLKCAIEEQYRHLFLPQIIPVHAERKDIKSAAAPTPIISAEMVDLCRSLEQQLTPLVQKLNSANTTNASDINFRNQLLYYINNMTRAMNNELDLAKICDGKMELSPIDFNLRELAMFIQASNLPITIHLPAGSENIFIHVDQALLQTLLLNLAYYLYNLSNAQQIQITFALHKTTNNAAILDCSLKIVSSNTATVMPFERTQQVALSLINKIGVMLAGNLPFNPFHGSELEYGLAIACTIAPAKRIEKLLAPRSTQPTHKPHILIVEDNDLNRRMLATMLQHDYQVTAVANGQEAVDAVKQVTDQKSAKKPDLILMDLNMPVMDGLDAARHIRMHEYETKTQPTPIIGLSGNANDEKNALAAGMTAYVAKPYERGPLLKKIKSVLMNATIVVRSPISTALNTPLTTDSEITVNASPMQANSQHAIVIPQPMIMTRENSAQATPILLSNSASVRPAVDDNKNCFEKCCGSFRFFRTSAAIVPLDTTLKTAAAPVKSASRANR